MRYFNILICLLIIIIIIFYFKNYELFFYQGYGYSGNRYSGGRNKGTGYSEKYNISNTNNLYTIP